MVDAVVSVFLERLLKVLSEESQYVIKYRDHFEQMKKELLFMQSFMKDAARDKRKNETLRTAMAELRDLIYEAQDILSDCHVQTKDLVQRYHTGRRLSRINENIARIKQNISAYLRVPLLNEAESMKAHDGQMPRWSSPVYDHSQVVGLEGDTEKLKDWLFGASQEILAVGIVGMGGLGKTTVAQKVFNDRRVEDHFERRIWVSVSQTFTQEQIMRSILRSLGDVSLGDDPNELLRKINQYLLGKRYLLVMDDVWSKDNTWWLNICQGLPKGNGSSVIITTRIENVACKMGVTEVRMHRPKFLSEDNSWLLFRKVAFAATGGRCNYPDLEGVGKEIVEKCKGLPLAIKAIGGVMLCKPPYCHEWRRISNCFRDELAENGDLVMASLQLSYDELPPFLKSCFLCFSLFPEDCVILKQQMINWWIGEGFVPLRNGRLVTDVGEDCFSELSNRCLVEVVDRAYNGVIKTCKVHDMVRDLVIQVAAEDAFSAPNDHRGSRHLGIKDEMDGDDLAKNRRLRALLTTTKSGEVNKISSHIAKKFPNCQRLQVLDVSKSIFTVSLSSLFDEIGALQHLTCLSLSNTHPLTEIPSSISELRHLLILDISYCQNLRMLPPCIVHFEKLAVLDASNCGSLDHFPIGLGNLSNLQVLLGFKPARGNQPKGCRIGELRSLSKLRKLGLRLTQGDEIGDDEADAIVNLCELQYLSLSCFDSHRDDDLVLQVDKLEPPAELHELSLEFFPGRTSPSWLNPRSLHVLRYLSIISGNMERLSEGFWGDGNGSWKIEGLKLRAVSELCVEWERMQGAMPSLKLLSVSWCPEVELVPVEDSGFRGGMWKKQEHGGGEESEVR